MFLYVNLLASLIFSNNCIIDILLHEKLPYNLVTTSNIYLLTYRYSHILGVAQQSSSGPETLKVRITVLFGDTVMSSLS